MTLLVVFVTRQNDGNNMAASLGRSGEGPYYLEDFLPWKSVWAVLGYIVRGPGDIKK